MPLSACIDNTIDNTGLRSLMLIKCSAGYELEGVLLDNKRAYPQYVDEVLGRL